MNSYGVYIDEKEASRLCGIPVPTLRNHRYRKIGIPFYKMGRSIRYKRIEVLDFVEGSRVITKPIKRNSRWDQKEPKEEQNA